ncbi:MAG TPA: GNAT family N-acetyltransferase [Candidatus Ozemobacteraceae bacterium]|nr:GNAT family N-acetyltransferase [Candidatus Ozemobacteraceae bacterium]
MEQLRPDDWTSLQAVAALEEEAFPDDAQTAPNLALIARAGTVWVARDERGGIVGEAILLGTIGEAAAFLFSLAVTATWRRQGISLVLMRTVFDDLRARGVTRLELTCDPQNAAALRLYTERLGCERIELLPDHFGPGRSRWLLRKTLCGDES